MALELLTDKRVKHAKPAPGEARLELRDLETRGLELRVTKGGAKTWALLYTRKSDGTVRRVTIGPYPQIGLAEARIADVVLAERLKRARQTGLSDFVRTLMA